MGSNPTLSASHGPTDDPAPRHRHGARLAAWVVDIFLMTLVTTALTAVSGTVVVHSA